MKETFNLTYLGLFPLGKSPSGKGMGINMKGLLIKDYKLMKNQKQFFLMILGICTIFLIVYENPLFIISYLTIMFSIFAISTISYDEQDNGMAFLFTLPVTRKAYTATKYIFGLTLTLCTMALSSLLVLATCLLKGISLSTEEFIGILGVSFLLSVLMLSVSIPLQLKFGSEKSRIALLLSYGAIFLAGYALISIAKGAGINLEGLLEKLLNASPALLIAGACIICAAIAGASYAASVKIIEKKQF